MDCPKEVVVSCLETLGKTFLSMPRVSCNPPSGWKMPSTQPWPGTLHLYS
jgi:hypothetical protein